MATGFDAGRVHLGAVAVGAAGQFDASVPLVQQLGDAYSAANNALIQQAFIDFFRNFRRGEEFPYRDALRSTQRRVEIDLQDVARYAEPLYRLIMEHPASIVPLVEEAAAQLAPPAPRARPGSDMPFQVLLASSGTSSQIRSLDSASVSRMVHVHGIVINASRTRAKATVVKYQCRNCGYVGETRVPYGFGGVSLPRRCPESENARAVGAACPLDPFQLLTERTIFVDQQTLKLQELPEDVPTGEVPRHIVVTVDRTLVEVVVPGTRVSVLAVFSTASQNQVRGASVKLPYLRCVGLQANASGSGRMQYEFTEEEAARFRLMASDPHIHESIFTAIAPSIFGNDMVKKSIACLLFGGSRKILPDLTRLRGDINVLLLGDPGVAKSQFLKFTQRIAPVGVYTSGKGSSAAGLTASVLRDPSSGEFVIEGGAMVLGDGGVVCVDEFDKMRPEDRVAIHEAMEQQTISIAKAGITTVLNSRCSVLAAANPVFGRYDDDRSLQDNIDFQTTILSRFDMIFLLRDRQTRENDIEMVRHVIGVHASAGNTDRDSEAMSSSELKRYIAYCRQFCSPRISPDAAETLSGHFVTVRQHARKHSSAIPITVRQLEALVRITESLAKMQLKDEATTEHAKTAIELFNASTGQAIESKAITIEGMYQPTAEEIHAVQTALAARLPIGSTKSTRQLIDEVAMMRNVPEGVVIRVIAERVRAEVYQYRDMHRKIARVKA